jgi:hypothetical protein
MCPPSATDYAALHACAIVVEPRNVADVPNNWEWWDRCIIYDNDKSGASSMQCNFGDTPTQ